MHVWGGAREEEQRENTEFLGILFYFYSKRVKQALVLPCGSTCTSEN